MSNDYELNIDNEVKFEIDIQDVDYTIELNNTTDYVIELNEQGPQGAIGPQGIKGDTGPSNTLTIGSVESGSTSSVTITGTSPNQVLNFVLEKGDKGDTGDQGPQGPPGDVGDVKVNNTSVVTSGIANIELKTINNNSIVGSGNVDIDALPSQIGQSGKYLTTNGSVASWVEVLVGANTDLSNLSFTGENHFDSKYVSSSNPILQAVYLKTCYVNGTSGYNIWSNGYCEQWGRTTMNAVAPITVTFAKNFKDINYNSFSSIGGVGSVNNNSYIIATLGKTVSGMNIENYNSGTGNNNWYEWRACGYLASGQY